MFEQTGNAGRHEPFDFTDDKPQTHSLALIYLQYNFWFYCGRAGIGNMANSASSLVEGYHLPKIKFKIGFVPRAIILRNSYIGNNDLHI